MPMFYFICIYIFIVVGVIFSHFFLSSRLKKYNANIEKSKKYWESVQKRFETNNNYNLKKKEIRKLKKPQALAAFYEIVSKLPQEIFSQIIAVNKTQMITLGKRYKSTTVRAYFAYILSTSQTPNLSSVSGYDDLMLEYILDNSVYSRENALKALYAFGNAEKVVTAFQKLSAHGISHSEKLLTDGLLTFTGDSEKLASLFMETFDTLLECYQISVIHFFSYRKNHRFDRILIQHLKQADTTIDIKCCILRTIGKIQSEENKRVLMSALEQYKDAETWEPAAVAASLLGQYEGDEQIMRLLCNSVTSRNWHVRMNSAGALIQIGISEDSLQQILNGPDAYAKNALLYVMNQGKQEA